MRVDIEGEEHEVTDDEAERLAIRFIDSHYGNAPTADMPRPVASIPADRKRDSDLRLMAYIRHVPKLHAEIERLRAALNEALGRGGAA